MPEGSAGNNTHSHAYMGILTGGQNPRPDTILESNPISPQEFLRLLHSLQGTEAYRTLVQPDGTLDPRLKILRAWQSERLNRTYSDLLADPGYRLACLFVLEELYAPFDFSQRDQDAERIYTILARYLPESALILLGGAIYLTRLTDELDYKLLKVLFDKNNDFTDINEAQYIQAYVECDNYDQRVEQIALVHRLMRQAVRGARSLIFRTGLQLSKTPLEKLGWSDLYTFLQRGVEASKRMPDVNLFLNSIQNREMEILNRIYRGVPAPFNIVP